MAMLTTKEQACMPSAPSALLTKTWLPPPLLLMPLLLLPPLQAATWQAN